jgi:signal transduction histidine kinase/CheY-like chemotaxis protein
MNEVSCRTTAAIIRSLVARGIDATHMAHGISVGLETLEDPSARIPWDDFVQVLRNCGDLTHGPAGLEEICATFYPQNDGLLKDLGRQLLSPRALYHMGARWYGPWLIPCTRAQCKDLPDGRILQTIEIQPDREDSELFFHAMCGSLRTVPSLLGLPPADVKMERGPRKAAFTITPPQIGRIERVQRMLRRRRGAVAGADEELTIHFEELMRSYEQARTMTAELDETNRRLDLEREERDRVEQMLQQSQKLDAMGQLAGGIAHDFNNVLTAIGGYADLAIEQLEEAHPVHADIAEIRDVAERGAALVQQILGFSRRRDVTPQQLELNAVALRMQTLLERLLPESIDLQIEPSDEPLPVIADSGQLDQVIINLVLNSRDAMPGGGSVRVDLTRRHDPERGDVARLELTDDGRGMDAETAAQAFEPFFTTKARDKGTGLGLATVHGIVAAVGGRIDLQSRVGEGTTVTVEWPLAAEEDAVPAGGAEIGTHPRGGTETVLVVEDDDDARDLIERTLAAAGYTVITASESGAALDLARSHPTGIQLLVTDLALPAEDGPALATRIYDLRSELRGALLLGDSDEAKLASPANQARLAKPFDRPALLRAARRILDA